MPIKTAQFKIQGMNQDNSESAFPEKFAFEIMNMRIDARNDNTFLSLTNEKGNSLLASKDPICGSPLGYAVIDNEIILFTHNNNSPRKDYIYSIILVGESPTALDVNILFEGNIGFIDNWYEKKPIETLAWWESDTIRKVYWIDGIHQPRMINVAGDNLPIQQSYQPGVIYDGFDFNRKLQLEEEVEISQGYDGQFHSGVVQYFITYYDKNGSESNIAWQSPLMYVSFDDRGGSPEDIVPKSFTLKINHIDQHYDYMRLYCVQRTTLNGEVYVRRVQDFPKGTDLYTGDNGFTDNGILGELVDSTYLMYVGGDELIAGCFTQKDQVLFLGDIKNQDIYINASNPIGNVTIGTKYVPINDSNATGNYYHYFHQANMQGYEDIYNQPTQGNSSVSTFKYLETYRFGVQFQFDNGRWSNVLYVGDEQITERIRKNNNNKYIFSKPIINLSPSDIPNNSRIVKARPVCVYPDTFERNIICQGILCPTVYNTNDRVTGKTFSYGSWFSRPIAPDDILEVPDGNGGFAFPENHNFGSAQSSDYHCGILNEGSWEYYDNNNYPLNPYAIRNSHTKNIGCWAEFRHNYGIPGPQKFNGEIQMQFRDNGGMVGPLLPMGEEPLLSSPTTFNDYFANGFNVDQSIVTLHSPDIEFNDNVANVALRNAKLRIIGFVPLVANSGDIDIDASTVGGYKAYHWRVEDGETAYVNEIPSSKKPSAFYEEKVGAKINSRNGWLSLINGPYWQDKMYNPSFIIDKEENAPADLTGNDFTFDAFPITEWIRYGFIVYPWQQHGSLSNGNPEDDYSVLKKKILSNLKYSLETQYFEKRDDWYPNEGFWTSANGVYDKDDSGLSDAVYINSENHFTLLKSPYGNGSISYDGNMDKILTYNKNDWSPKLAVFDTNAFKYNQQTIGWYVNADLRKGPSQEDLHRWYPPEESYILYVESSFIDYSITTDTVYTSQDYYRMYNDDDYFLEDNGLQYIYRTIREEYNINVVETGIPEGSVYYKAKYTNNSSQLISMKYKCSPHIVMALNNQDSYTANGNTYTHLQRCLPVPCKEGSPYFTPINAITSDNGSIQGTVILNDFNGRKLYFDPNYSDASTKMNGCLQRYLPQADFTNETHGGYWLAELYRDGDASNKFGGNSPEALSNNVWCVCGEAQTVDRINGNALDCTEGDTFYQRYDNLKTLPYSENDENQIIEIVSFMCESRINIDGRYDKQRGIDNCNYIIPEAFNKVNEVYSQLDNYLSQTYITEENISLTRPNTIIWSDKKINGEDVDIWTQLHTENFLDLEGHNGKINALKTFRNEVYAFQDSAIAQVLYNSRTALATVEGSPVQLASSGLVEGKQYITNSMGCLNKWSICETPIGLVFTDDLNKSIMVMGEGFDNLSEKYGMSTWVRDYVNTVPWDLNFSNMVTYYDKNNKDILFVTEDTALAYSVKLGVFTSFYSYGKTPFIVNYKNKVLDVREYLNSGDYYTQIWEQNAGAYNSFYNSYSPFSITFIVNDNPTTDKIFNTIEYRADFFNSYGEYEAGVTFDYVRAWNEYQDTLDQPVGNVSTMTPNDIKKKFRMWRLNIPRNYSTMDRIRNPWTYIKLKKVTNGQTPYNGKVQLHDIQVHYTE